MKLEIQQHHFTELEYLAFELDSEIKHELIDGRIYDMSGGTNNHNDISMNIMGYLFVQLGHSLCKPCNSDTKVKVGNNFFYPDVMVKCETNESGQDHFITSPVIIFEVLSKSTSKKDRTKKLLSYLNIESLQAYVMVEQSKMLVEVLRKSDGFKPCYYFKDDSIPFKTPDISLSVNDIYAGLDISEK
ncbi:MAG: Uma2 family endonuclease [Methylococcales bacterium]|jgi:Uma2 family endonuclease|nr:Uma2 family endonuclease [Methylococcales bacterium]MBT7410517.1 Uma2 family endonuclease [Methylococcales bacterium]